MAHPDAGTRQALEQALRRLFSGSLFISHAETPARVLELARSMEPDVVFLDLNGPRALTLDVARVLRRPHRLIVGLFNPLLLNGDQCVLLRDAARAGIGDFIAVPVSEAELGDALEHIREWAEAGPMRDGQVIAFYSQKGGSGKTTLAVHAALAMATAEKDGETLLLDAVAPYGDASALLRVDSAHDLTDLVTNLDHLGPLDSYSSREPRTGLHLIASPVNAMDALRITPELLGRALIALRTRFARVVVDLPSSLDLYTATALDLADIVCLITEPVPATAQRSAELLKLLNRQGFDSSRVRLVLNKGRMLQDGLSADEVEEEAGRAVQHVIPFDQDVAEVAVDAESMFVHNPKSDFVRAVTEMAGELAQVAPGRRKP